MRVPEVLINPFIRVAVLPEVAETLEQLPAQPMQLPCVGDELMLPFLVDRQTRQPARVRVVQIHKQWDQKELRHTLVVVVTRATQA
jgi:hypothetical protein